MGPPSTRARKRQREFQRIFIHEGDFSRVYQNERGSQAQISPMTRRAAPYQKGERTQGENRANNYSPQVNCGLYRAKLRSQAKKFPPGKARAYIRKREQVKAFSSRVNTLAKFVLTRITFLCYPFPNGLAPRAIRAGSAPSLGVCLSLPLYDNRKSPPRLYVVTRRCM